MISRLFLLFVIFSFTGACKKDTPKETPKSAKDWVFDSEIFRIKLPASWKKEDPLSLNSFAKFAASKDDKFFVLVIPQKLPEIPGVDLPDAFALKRASINIMKKEDKEFKIEVEGPANISNIIAQSVVASGVVDGKKIQYVTSYLTSGTTGIQIVAWGPYEEGKELVKETDTILSEFEVLIKAPTPKNDIKTDTNNASPKNDAKPTTNSEQKEK